MQRPGACLLGKLGCQVYGILLSADDQLTGAVVVADLHHAFFPCPGAALCQGDAVQPHHGGHPAGDAFSGLGHGFAAESGQLDGLFGGEHTCRL